MLIVANATNPGARKEARQGCAVTEGVKAGFAAAALLLLAACAGQADTAEWTRWVCDSGAEVRWRFADSSMEQVDVRLNESNAVYRLRQEPAGAGELYSDGRLSFHTQGEAGLLYWTASDDLIGRGCQAPESIALN